MISERQMSKYQTETDSPVIGFNIKVRLWKYNGPQSLLPCILCSDLLWSKMTGVDVMSIFPNLMVFCIFLPQLAMTHCTKQLKTRQEPKTKEQAQNVLEDDYENCLQRF